MRTNSRSIGALVLFIILMAAIAAVVLYWSANSSTAVGPSPTASGGSGAPLDAAYITASLNGVLTSERQLVGTADQVIVVDNGAGSTLVLSLPQDIATTSDVDFNSVQLTGNLFLNGGSNEFITVDAPANIRMSGRDNFIIELDSNANSTSTFCIEANGTTNAFCVNESGSISLATIDGDLNTLVDIKPDSFDSVDAGADEECLTYEGTNTVEWQPCGSGGSVALENDLPIVSGGSSSTSNYSGIPGITFQDSSSAFVTANDIYLQPFHTVESITINRVSFEVTSAGNPGDSCRVGLYESDGNWQPGALVADWGQVVNDTTGYKHATVNTTIAAGDYLMALLCNSGPALRGYNGKSYISGGVDTSTTAGSRFVNTMRVSSPTAGQHAGGFTDPGDNWDAVDLNVAYNYGYWMLLRWS